MRGLRNLDQGKERLTDDVARRTLRTRALKMWAVSLAITAAVQTTLAVL